MEIDFTKILTDLDGNSIKEAEERDLTLGTVCIQALLATIPGDEPKGEDKLDRYVLATLIKADNSADLKSEDVVLIKKLLGLVYGTIIVGQAYLMLEGKL